MQQPDFSLPVKHFVELLVAGDYQAVIDQSFDKQHQQALWIAEAVHSYPGQLSTPPVSAYEAIDVYKYDDGSGYMLEFFCGSTKSQVTSCSRLMLYRLIIS
jgi:hypothetical protein